MAHRCQGKGGHCVRHGTLGVSSDRLNCCVDESFAHLEGMEEAFSAGWVEVGASAWAGLWYYTVVVVEVGPSCSDRGLTVVT